MQKTTAALTARDVYQVLKELALGIRMLSRRQENPAGEIEIETEGWHLTLVCEDGKLSHCHACRSADGRLITADSWQRYGTDPVKLLSIWEHEQLVGLLLPKRPQE